MIIDDFTSIDYLFIVAKSALDDLLPGEEFKFEDLFRPFEWKRLNSDTKQNLEESFFDYAKNANSIGLLEISSTNEQIYIKLQ